MEPFLQRVTFKVRLGMTLVGAAARAQANVSCFRISVLRVVAASYLWEIEIRIGYNEMQQSNPTLG